MRTGDLGGRPIIKPSMELVMVGATGIEPVTPSMSRKCSPAELRAPPTENERPYSWIGMAWASRLWVVFAAFAGA